MADIENLASLARNATLHSVVIATKTVSYTFLSLTILDWVANLQYETEHIWTKRSCKVKWQYLWSRYIGLLGEVLCIVAMNRLYTSTSIPFGVCYSWHVFQLISGHSIFMMLEFTAALRVVALYDRTWRIYIGVGLLLLAEFAINMVIAFWVFGRVEMLGSCGIADTPILIAVVPITKAMTQLTLWLLTLWKCRKQDAPLVSLIRRDGSTSFVSVILVLVGTTIQFTLAGFQHIHAEQAYHLLFPIFLFAMSTTNCRVIKNMEVYARTQASAPNSGGEGLDPTILLTTIISEYSTSTEVSVPSTKFNQSSDSPHLTRRISGSSTETSQ